MTSFCLSKLVGVCLAILGFLGTILICGLPMWKVTAFVGANIVTAQVFWEGLWMNCVIQSTGHSQCKAYDSLLALPQELCNGKLGRFCLQQLLICCRSFRND
uniref:Claudin n=1 Tax=Mola mola TaxID=94237 RepID=A0A3Q4BEC5_MOLML